MLYDRPKQLEDAVNTSHGTALLGHVCTIGEKGFGDSFAALFGLVKRFRRKCNAGLSTYHQREGGFVGVSEAFPRIASEQLSFKGINRCYCCRYICTT